MRILEQCKVILLALCASFCSLAVVAQESAVENKQPEKIAATKTATLNTNSATEKLAKGAAEKTDAKKLPEQKKMVQDATISLQTTITGNQEQPKVLYILPWQSPAPTDVDFESLDNQQKAVFNHVERDELRRELETSDTIKD